MLGGTILHREIRKGLSEEVNFKQRTEEMRKGAMWTPGWVGAE